MKNKLGLDTILILVAVIVTAIFLILALANKGEYIDDGTEQPSEMSQAIQQANDPALFNFNQRLRGYAGNQSGLTIKALIKKVEEINAGNERKVDLTGTENVDENEEYNVSLSYGDDGYINAIKVEKK